MRLASRLKGHLWRWRLALLLLALSVSVSLIARARTERAPQPAVGNPPASTTAPTPAGLGEPGPARAIGVQNARSAIGYNLDLPGDWTQLRPFIDLMRNARAWYGICPDEDPKCDQYRHMSLDAHGWPRTSQYRDARTLAYRWLESVVSSITSGTDIGRVFVLTWEGTGDIEVFNADLLGMDAKKRRLTFRLHGDNTILKVLRTDPLGTGDYIRDVRIFREDHEPLLARGELWNPEMLDYLEPFGNLRFMHWMQSNDAEPGEATWAERARPDIYPWLNQTVDLQAPCAAPNDVACRRIGGYPVEVLVSLANRLGADPHFSMPYRATDNWVLNFAAAVRAQLAKNLRVTVEYSNEVWNWGFPQASYAKEQGEKLWPGEGAGWLEFMGKRAGEVCRLWKMIFAGEERRVRCMIGPQTAWHKIASASLDCPHWVALDPKRHRPCAKEVDAIGITGYFGGDLHNEMNDPVIRRWLAEGEAKALDRAFRYLETGEPQGLLDYNGKPLKPELADSLPTAIARFKRWKKIADEHGLDLLVYEGGNHFGRPSGDLRRFLAHVATDERMVGAYRRLLDAYREAGGTVWNAFGGVSAEDAWGNGESLADRHNAKYRALTQFAAANPCWWTGCDREKR